MTTLTRSRLRHRLLHRLHTEKGFTLVELLVVVIILGVLSAIAVPAFLNQQGRAKILAAQTAAVDAARACAAAQITGEEDEFNPPANVAGVCGPAGGDDSDFTADAADFDVTQAPIATVAGNGEVGLTQCATADGWAEGAVPSCIPTRE